MQTVFEDSMTFLNFTNHPSEKWDILQIEEANKYGEIRDLPFPSISEYATNSEIRSLALHYLKCIDQIARGTSCTIHIMGEMTFTYAMVNLLKSHGYTCVASTTKRIVEELPDGVKNVKFEFCQFREY